MNALDILQIITLFLLAIILGVFIVIEVKSVMFIRNVNNELDRVLDFLKSINWVFTVLDIVTSKIKNLKSDIFENIKKILKTLFTQ